MATSREVVEKILVVRDALSPEECAELMRTYDRTYQFGSQRDYSNNPSVHYWDLYDKGYRPEAALLKRVALRGQEIVQQHYGELHLVEATFISRQLPGSVIEPHYDNVKIDGCTPNHTPQRTHSSLFYPNAGYQGGQLVFPRQAFQVDMRPGTFVAFPSGFPYLHMVRPIRGCNRYTVPVWMTTSEKLALKFRED